MGRFSDVSPEVWNFSISGLNVAQAWLGYRMKKRSGRSSSPLDDLRPQTWTFDEELLDLLWVLEHTVARLPELEENLAAIVQGALFDAADFPEPTLAERKGPDKSALQPGLF